MEWAVPFTVALSYLLGSMPSAYIAGRLVEGLDIREVGGGNVGTVNAFRELGPWAGVSVGAVDVGKGVLAVLVVRWAEVSQWAVLLARLAAVAGHNWPIFLKFRGSKGEATPLGSLLALMPREILLPFVVVAPIFFITRNPTLSLAFVFALVPALAWWFGRLAPLISYSGGLGLLVGLKHLPTAIKLLADAEDKRDVIVNRLIFDRRRRGEGS